MTKPITKAVTNSGRASINPTMKACLKMSTAIVAVIVAHLVSQRLGLIHALTDA
jgi:type III secretory pathway component EscU